MPLRVVQKMLCDKNQERFMGRFAEEYPLGAEPGPSFLIRKVQADGSSRDFLFDGSPYIAPEAGTPAASGAEQKKAPPATAAVNTKAPAATAAGQVKAPAATAAGSVLELAKTVGGDATESLFASELTARESACLADPPEPDEPDECLCAECSQPFLPKISAEELDARIEELLGGLGPVGGSSQTDSSAKPFPATPAAVQEQRQAALTKADAAPRCLHVKSDGKRCGSAAIKGDPFCYFHGEARAKRALAQMNDLQLPVLEDRRSLQLAIMRVNALAANKSIDAATARLLFSGLRLAQQNLARTGSLDFRRGKRGAI